MGGDEFPLTLPSLGAAEDFSFEEIVESLRAVGIEVVPGGSDEGVIAEDENGSRFILPKNFNIFTNPVKKAIKPDKKD